MELDWYKDTSEKIPVEKLDWQNILKSVNMVTIFKKCKEEVIKLLKSQCELGYYVYWNDKIVAMLENNGWPLTFELS